MCREEMRKNVIQIYDIVGTARYGLCLNLLRHHSSTGGEQSKLHQRNSRPIEVEIPIDHQDKKNGKIWWSG